MSAILVLPAADTPVVEVQRALVAMRYRLGEQPPIDIVAPGSHRQAYAQALTPAGLKLADALRVGPGTQFVAQLEDENQQVTPVAGLPATLRQYRIRHGQMLLQQGTRDALDDAHLDAHLFNRLSGGLQGFYFFPYAYLFRNNGLGPTNEFGHRITASFDALARRPASHKVIAIFGGSAGWSIFAQYEEMFAHRLQIKLNERSAAARLELEFTVLNLAQNGNVTLNEMLTYMLFCDRLRPDVVIAHDGFNDLAYGQATDSALLRHGITYQTNIEHWGKILHDAQNVPVVDLNMVCPVQNAPPSILQSYARRQRQFQSLVQGQGGVFVAALQPTIFSKASNSPAERRAIEKQTAADSHYREIYKNMPLLFEKYVKMTPQLELTHFANLHAYFAAFDGSQTHFVDIMHTTPLGDELIAGYYDHFLAQHVMPRWLEKPSTVPAPHVALVAPPVTSSATL